MIGIYKITSPNNRVYVGSSNDIGRRFREYKTLSKSKGQLRLNRSFKKYGVNNHSFEVLIECSLEELYRLENYYGHLYNVLSKAGLNLSLPKLDNIYGGLSDKTKQKIAASHLGKIFTTTHKENISKAKKGIVTGSKNNFYGKNHTEKFKKERSISRIAGGNPNAKVVFDPQTGIYYSSILEAADAFNVNKSHLATQLRGGRKKYTRLVYC